MEGCRQALISVSNALARKLSVQSYDIHHQFPLDAATMTMFCRQNGTQNLTKNTVAPRGSLPKRYAGRGEMGEESTFADR